MVLVRQARRGQVNRGRIGPVLVRFDARRVLCHIRRSVGYCQSGFWGCSWGNRPISHAPLGLIGHRHVIPFHPLTRPQKPLGDRGRAKKRLALIGKGRGNPGETDRAKAVFGGKSLGLGQSFARDGGNISPPAAAHIIKRQVRHRIGGGPVKCRAHVVVTGPGRIKRQVFDLIVRNQQFGPQSLWIKRQPGFAQHRQLAGQIGRVDRHLSDQSPDRCRTGAGPVQQSDTFE